MAISLGQNIRLPLPYESKCMDQYPSILINKGAPNMTHYSAITCRRICLNNYIMTTCKCIDPLSMDARMMTESDYSSRKFCSVNHESNDRICVNKAQADYVKYLLENEYPCECGPDCLTNNYKVSLCL